MSYQNSNSSLPAESLDKSTTNAQHGNGEQQNKTADASLVAMAANQRMTDILPAASRVISAEKELFELQVYSSIWLGSIFGLANGIIFKVVPNRIAVVAGAILPWVAGKQVNLMIHAFLSTFLTFDPSEYTRDQGTATKAPVPLEMVVGRGHV
jgi:hypothetical protein